MARIAGVDIPNNKRVEIALTYIYGIGRKSANDILAATGINPDTRAKDLTEDEIAKLRDEIERNYHVEGDLRREVSMVLQKNVLFSGTILDNLRWGDENASEEECIRVARLACADEFSAPRPTQEQEKALPRPLQTRRSKGVA